MSKRSKKDRLSFRSVLKRYAVYAERKGSRSEGRFEFRMSREKVSGEVEGGRRRGMSVKTLSIVTAQAPAVRAGRSSAPSGTVLGGNSDAFTTRASKEENKYRQVGIADRSCWTGEPARTGSPAGDLQLSEGHLAGILDDSCVGDSFKG